MSVTPYGESQVSHLTLADSEVRETLDLFIGDARICARTYRVERGGILGNAAICTIFPCILTVGEALARETKGDEDRVSILESITAFYQEMNDKQSWLLPPEGKPRDDTAACDRLRRIRDGLAHALSGPRKTMLLPTREAEEHYPRNLWRIVVPDFIEAVDETIKILIGRKPQLSLDGVIKESQWQRGLAHTPEPGGEELRGVLRAQMTGTSYGK